MSGARRASAPNRAEHAPNNSNVQPSAAGAADCQPRGESFSNITAPRVDNTGELEKCNNTEALVETGRPQRVKRRPQRFDCERISGLDSEIRDDTLSFCSDSADLDFVPTETVNSGLSPTRVKNRSSNMPKCDLCGAEVQRNRDLGRHYLSKHRLLWTGTGTRPMDDAEYAERLSNLRMSQMSARSRRLKQAAEFAAETSSRGRGSSGSATCGRLMVERSGGGAVSTGGGPSTAAQGIVLGEGSGLPTGASFSGTSLLFDELERFGPLSGAGGNGCGRVLRREGQGLT